MISLFPSFVQEEDKNGFHETITLGEVEAVLRGFKKDKSPGPDGWPVEFFLAFFYLLGEDLHCAAEQARQEGLVTGAVNSTSLH